MGLVWIIMIQCEWNFPCLITLTHPTAPKGPIPRKPPPGIGRCRSVCGTRKRVLARQIPPHQSPHRTRTVGCQGARATGHHMSACAVVQHPDKLGARPARQPMRAPARRRATILSGAPYSRSPKNPALQLLQKSSKSASAGSYSWSAGFLGERLYQTVRF